MIQNELYMYRFYAIQKNGPTNTKSCNYVMHNVIMHKKKKTKRILIFVDI